MRRLALALLATGALAACGGSPGEAPGEVPGQAARTADGAGPTGTLSVFAAASLTDVFTGLAERFEADNPGVQVRFNFAASSALATQIVQGAPADVFASAAPPQMDAVAEAGLVDGEPVVFTANVLRIAVPAGNPAGVEGLADFAREELALALCAPEVPCGAAAERVLAAAGVTARPDTLEEDVRAALTKVELGEVDAALVYATDVTAAGDAVEGIGFPEAEQAVNEYPIAVLAGAPAAEAAEAFLELVRSEVGREALTAAGFRAP